MCLDLLPARSLARLSTSRDTVGSAATGPNGPDSARNTEMSARQSPPTANAIAGSHRSRYGLAEPVQK